MKKLAELQARLKALKAEGLDIVSQAETDDRDLSDDEASRIAEITTEQDEVNVAIEAINRRADARRSMEAISVGGAEVGGLSAHGQNTVHDSNPATTGGFKDISEFSASVRSACRQGAIADPRLLGLGDFGGQRNQAGPTNFHSGGGDQGEGFLVPPQFRDEIFEVMEAVDEFGPMVDEESTLARRVDMLADEDTPWGAQGVQANWRSEGTQMTASRLNTDPRSLAMHEIYAFVLASGELLDDAPRLAGRLTRRAGEAIAWKKNSAMMRGTGAGQPLGWINSGAAITVAKEAAQGADTIDVQNILKMFTRISVLPGDRPIWLINRNVLPQLMTLVIGDQPMWVTSGGLAAAPGGFLLGIPIMFTEHASTLGDFGDIQLMSPRGYYSVVHAAGPKFDSSIHLYFDYNVEAFRWMTRFGGQPHLEAPIDAPTAGGGAANSKSHFVILAERA